MLTVAVPTRHGLVKLKKFVDSFIATTTPENRPRLVIIDDMPDDGDPTESFARVLERDQSIQCHYIRNTKKKGLAALWNQCIIESKTDWVLVCNDDGVFQQGWLEWLTEMCGSGKYNQVNIMHYGGFCLHKKLILLNGWFDENFRGGGFEDNDWQLRIYEGGLYSSVYNWTENWKYMKHEKVNDASNWKDENNYEWMEEKWSKNCCWATPAYRLRPEIDWHPEYTKEYEEKYGLKSRIELINTWVNSKTPIYHAYG